MNTRTLLAKAVEVIGFVFAAFSGFLKSIAPPEEANATFAVGISSFLALTALLFTSAVAKNVPARKHKRLWLIGASVLFVAALVSATLYKRNLDRLTFPYPPENAKAEYIGGTEMTPEAKAYKERTRRSDSSVLAAYGGLTNREEVWTSDSIQKAKLILTINYGTLVLCLASTIFCLTEGILRK